MQQLKQFNIVKTIKNMPLHTKIIQVSAGLLIVFTVANTYIFNGLQSMVWCVPKGTDYFCLWWNSAFLVQIFYKLPFK